MPIMKKFESPSEAKARWKKEALLKNKKHLDNLDEIFLQNSLFNVKERVKRKKARSNKNPQ